MADTQTAYIGDGVYVIVDDFGVRLYANDACAPTDKVYLAWDVYHALVSRVKWMTCQAQNPDAQE